MKAASVTPQLEDHNVATSQLSQSQALGVASPQPLSEASGETEAQIRDLAYKLYEERGRAEGLEIQDWLEAEAIIRQGSKLAA